MVSHSHTAIAAPYLKSKSPFPKLSLPMNKLGIIMCTEQGDIYIRQRLSLMALAVIDIGCQCCRQ